MASELTGRDLEAAVAEREVRPVTTSGGQTKVRIQELMRSSRAQRLVDWMRRRLEATDAR